MAAQGFHHNFFGIANLVHNGRITAEQAIAGAVDQEKIKRLLAA